MKYKLVCFDVDGTLIDNITFSWQLFHDYFQTDKHKREDAKRRFYGKEISYREWAEHDIQMWKDRNATKQEFFEAIEKGKLKLMEGAMETLLELKKRKMKLAIISGSLSIMLEKFIPNYNDIFDDVFISRIHFGKDGCIEKIEATEYDMEGKALAMRKIAEREGIRLKECSFVGDYLNDMKIMEEAGLGIAFNCKIEELKEAADVVIKKKDLREILKHIL